MKTAGIRQFRAHLGAYLREVAAGETVLVTDRGHVVAEVAPPGAARRAGGQGDLRFQQAVDLGLILPARCPGDPRGALWKDFKGLGLPPGTARALLDAEREEGAR